MASLSTPTSSKPVPYPAYTSPTPSSTSTPNAGTCPDPTSYLMPFLTRTSSPGTLSPMATPSRVSEPYFSSLSSFSGSCGRRTCSPMLGSSEVGRKATGEA
ncbi:hypothetical protein ACFX12_032740 [Malus domestica]